MHLSLPTTSQRPILKFQFDKGSRKWGQILYQFLKRNKQSTQAVWFVSKQRLIFAIEAKNKTTKAVLTILTKHITSFNFDASKYNCKLNGVDGFICAIKPVNMESFLLHTQCGVKVILESARLLLSQTIHKNTSTFSSKFLEVNDSYDALDGNQDQTYQCQLSLSHNHNNILESVFSICHNFKCKEVCVEYNDVKNNLLLTFSSSQASEPIEIGTVVHHNIRFLKRPRKFNAKLFASGLLSLEKCQSMELCFTERLVVFLSKFKDELVYKYYLTELEIIELDL